VISILAIFFTALLGTFSPLYFKQKKWLYFLKPMNYFSCGVFVTAGVVHLVGDGMSELSKCSEEESGYPVGLVGAAVGMLGVISFEKYVLLKFIPKNPSSLSSSPTISSCCTPSLSVSPFILTAALEVHAFIAGIGLGMVDEVAEIKSILLAVLAHKGIAG